MDTDRGLVLLDNLILNLEVPSYSLNKNIIRSNTLRTQEAFPDIGGEEGQLLHVAHA